MAEEVVVGVAHNNLAAAEVVRTVAVDSDWLEQEQEGQAERLVVAVGFYRGIALLHRTLMP